MCIRDRTVGEFNRGHMDGFKNIPVDELRERINEVEKEKPVYLICPVSYTHLIICKRPGCRSSGNSKYIYRCFYYHVRRNIVG